MVAECAVMGFYCAQDIFVICLRTGIDNTPPGQDFCNISSCKTRMNLNLGVFDLAGPQKALQKCFLSFDGMLETKLGDAEVYFNLDEAICQNLFV